MHSHSARRMRRITKQAQCLPVRQTCCPRKTAQAMCLKPRPHHDLNLVEVDSVDFAETLKAAAYEPRLSREFVQSPLTRMVQTARRIESSFACHRS